MPTYELARGVLDPGLFSDNAPKMQDFYISEVGLGFMFASRFNPSVAHAALAAAGMTDAVDRHVHVTVLARAVQQAGGQPVATLARAAA